MTRKKLKPGQQQRIAQTTRRSKTAKPTASFMEHLRELRKRLFYVAISVIGWSALAYAVQQHLVNALLKPSHGQSFVYTSPIGGVDFLFRVCLYSGIILSIPVIVYQLLCYAAPLMKTSSRRFIAIGSATSG